MGSEFYEVRWLLEHLASRVFSNNGRFLVCFPEEFGACCLICLFNLSIEGCTGRDVNCWLFSLSKDRLSGDLVEHGVQLSLLGSSDC